jgi:pimeloyl-ACP methyl ester carboxylesterase
MVDHTVAYMDAVGLEGAHIVGFSDGAIVALLLAMSQGDRVQSLVPISGNLDPSGAVEPALRDRAMPEAAFERVRADYVVLSPDGPDRADVVLARLFPIWQS